MGSFNDILYNIKSKSVLSISYWFKNIANKVTSNMKAASPQYLQKQAYPSFSIKYLLVQAVFSIWNWLITTIKHRRVRVSF